MESFKLVRCVYCGRLLAMLPDWDCVTCVSWSQALRRSNRGSLPASQEITVGAVVKQCVGMFSLRRKFLHN
jgi:hypothetical protein